MAMITGSWNKTTLICGNHPDGDEHKMIIQQGPHSLFYACPKHNFDKLEKGETPCYNRINLVDYEKMLNHIADILVDAEINGEEICLTNYTWHSKGKEFKVLKHDKDGLVIKFIDKIAAKGTKM